MCLTTALTMVRPPNGARDFLRDALAGWRRATKGTRGIPDNLKMVRRVDLFVFDALPISLLSNVLVHTLFELVFAMYIARHC